jgi:type I restriction enzyme R subunit
VESGVAAAEDVQRAKDVSRGLGLFVRSLIGRDREAAKRALATLRADQIEFLNLIVDHLTEHGCMDAKWLYGSPYTDFSPFGVDGLISSAQVDALVALLDDVRRRAAA